MADGRLTAPTRGRAVTSAIAAGFRQRWWLPVLAVYAASRAVSSIILLAFANLQEPTPWTGARPDVSTFSTMWDGVWYRYIAYAGYPTEIPRDSAGYATENAWAFLPVYPLLVRALATVTFLPYEVAAVLVAISCGGAAALVFNRLMARTLTHGALFATTLFCFAPTSVVLQLGYAESLQLLLLFAALHLLLDRRYLALIPLMLVLAFVRPGALAFALLLGLHSVQRWLTRRRDPFPPREIAALVITGLTTAALGFAWLVVAGLVTGEPTAYLDTELAWRAPYVGREELVPFTSWFIGAHWWLSLAGLADPGAWVGGILAVMVVLVAAALILLSPAARRLGVELRMWLASYSLYLLAVFFPQTSTFRLLMPLAPGLAILALPRSRWYRALLVLGCVALQVVWVWRFWWVDGADWTVP